MGTVVVLDDAGKVSQVLDAKMALASPRAKVDQRYSPVWEGILNLRRPEPGEDAEEYRSECSAVVTDWYKQYEAATGHKVLRVDVHLDEGHMVDGEAVLNAHAHVIADRTNDLGRVIKLSPKQLRELQTMTSEVTSLERGKSSFETGRKHINHHAYKHLAERGRLETQQVKVKLDMEIKLTNINIDKAKTAKAEVTKLQARIDGEPERLRLALIDEKYKLDREEFKRLNAEAAAAGLDKPKSQKDYSDLKKAYEAELKQANEKVETMTNQITQLTDENTQLKALWDAKTAHRDAELAKGIPDFLIDTTHVKAPPEATKPPVEASKPTEHPIAPPQTEKTLLEAFLELYAGVRRVALDVIDGCRLDAACGRVGVFSWPSSQRGKPRLQGLCEVPLDKVMPEVGQVFNGRAVPGQEGGVGR
jgi:hypothetical protein